MSQLLQEIEIREDDTEPLEIVLMAAGEPIDLSGVTAAVVYFRKVGAAANHVDGATLTTVDAPNGVARLNPVGAKVGGGNAFDERGTYRGHAKLTLAGGAIMRNPGDPKDDLVVKVAARLDA